MVLVDKFKELSLDKEFKSLVYYNNEVLKGAKSKLTLSKVLNRQLRFKLIKVLRLRKIKREYGLLSIRSKIHAHRGSKAKIYRSLKVRKNAVHKLFSLRYNTHGVVPYQRVFVYKNYKRIRDKEKAKVDKYRKFIKINSQRRDNMFYYSFFINALYELDMQREVLGFSYLKNRKQMDDIMMYGSDELDGKLMDEYYATRRAYRKISVKEGKRRKVFFKRFKYRRSLRKVSQIVTRRRVKKKELKLKIIQLRLRRKRLSYRIFKVKKFKRLKRRIRGMRYLRQRKRKLSKLNKNILRRISLPRQYFMGNLCGTVGSYRVLVILKRIFCKYLEVRSIRYKIILLYFIFKNSIHLNLKQYIALVRYIEYHKVGNFNSNRLLKIVKSKKITKKLKSKIILLRKNRLHTIKKNKLKRIKNKKVSRRLKSILNGMKVIRNKRRVRNIALQRMYQLYIRNRDRFKRKVKLQKGK